MLSYRVGGKMKRVSLVIILGMLCLIPINIKAETLQGMYSQLAELEKQQSSINSGKKMTQMEITNLKAEIVTINSNISNTEKEIKKAEASIVESENSIEAKKEETNQMLKYLQVTSGENVYLEYIFESDSYTEMIYRYAVVTQMSDYNNQLVDELNNLIVELENKKVELTNKQSELSTQKQQLSTKLATLNANLSELAEEGTSIADDIKSLKLDINKYEKLGCSRNEDVNACIKRNSVVPVSVGWNLPIVKGIITSQFQVIRTDCIGCGGTSHRGIDIGVAEGTKVYAAADGVVASVITSGSSLSCGGIKVYVYHNVNGQLYTSVYMHLLSANVSYGQSVTPSTVVGYSGGWTTSTKSGLGYDRCTTGAHLHFGVSYGNSVANFNSNAFNPRNLSVFVNAANGVTVSR